MTSSVHFYYYTDLPQEAIPPQMLDFIKIIENGAKKYELNGWLNANGTNTDKKNMYKSIFTHVADGYAGVKKDKDSGEDPRLHAACRLLMDYTRDKLGIIHPKDK